MKRGDADMRRQADVEAWIKKAKPDAIFIAAATVGGILANSTRPAEFLYDNLMIASNLIEAARQQGVKKLMYLGSSCIYPRLAEQPMAEEALLTGPLEPTNEWYAVAKIAGLKLCAAYRRQWGCDFISAQPTNLYGPGRHLRFAGKPRHSGADAQMPPRQARQRHERRDLGHRQAAARIPPCRRSGRRAGVPDGALYRREPRQCRLGRGCHDLRAGQAGGRGGRVQGRVPLRQIQARRRAAEAAWTWASSTPWAGGRASI